MKNSLQNEIRHLIDGISGCSEDVRIRNRMDALQSLLDAGDEIVALARKLTSQTEPYIKELADKPKQLAAPKPPGTQKTRKAKPKSRKDLTPIRPKPPV